MRSILVLLAVCCVLAHPLPASAKPRAKAVSPPQQTIRLLPGAEAPKLLNGPILTGLDYSAVAPPGVMLRVVEDEPYIYAQGDSARAAQRFNSGFSAIKLISVLPDGGRYEARILLRNAQGETAPQLFESFDQAAHSAYVRAGIAQERRELDSYWLSEVRSPLGLIAAGRPGAIQREFLAYEADIVNPLSAADFANLTTPYRAVTGQLQAAWEGAGRRAGAILLCVEFTAESFPHSLTLTENIARCVLNRTRDSLGTRERLNYLAYHPEFELPGLNELWYGQSIDSRTADLAERPGEGVGIDPQPIQGDLCPHFLGEGPAWPAQPYLDREHLRKLVQAGQPLPFCSHCLMSGALTDAQRRLIEQRERQVTDPRPPPQQPAKAHPVPEETESPPPPAEPEKGQTIETDAPRSVCRGDEQKCDGKVTPSSGCRRCAESCCGG